MSTSFWWWDPARRTRSSSSSSPPASVHHFGQAYRLLLAQAGLVGVRAPQQAADAGAPPRQAGQDVAHLGALAVEALVAVAPPVEDVDPVVAPEAAQLLEEPGVVGGAVHEGGHLVALGPGVQGRRGVPPLVARQEPVRHPHRPAIRTPAFAAGQRPSLRSAPMDRTLVICKPDAVERGLVGEIISRLERKGLRLVAAELRTIDEATARRHYEEHEGKAFFADLLSFITRSPAMLLVVEGPENTWQVVRNLMGATNPMRRGDGDDPGRSRHPAHREPRARLRLPRVGASARSACSLQMCDGVTL